MHFSEFQIKRSFRNNKQRGTKLVAHQLLQIMLCKIK